MQLKGQRIGQYRVLELLKRGGMGEVYLAEEEQLKRQVAIKVIWTDVSHHDDIQKAQEAVRLFLREAQTLAQFDHQHILPIFASGEGYLQGASFMYLVMPYRHEGSLTDWLHKNESEQLSVWDVDRILQQATGALQHAHNLNIIHQDVKASNFLIHGNAQFASRLELQLADFGIAKFMTTTDKSQEIRGTPRYMAPEQWDNRPVPATDQYALAVMVYELLTGRPPFIGTTKEQLWHQHCHVQPQPPSDFNSHIPPRLDAIILRALSKRATDRFESVAAFANAFRQAILNNRQIDSRIPRIPTRESHGRTATPVSLSNTSTVERTVPVSPSPVFFQPNQDQPPSKPPKHYRGKIAILLGLVVVLLAGSVGMLYLTWSYQQSVITGLTATARVRTATGASQQATAAQQTAITNTNATNTVQAQLTLTANAYATATQSSLMQTATAARATASRVASDSATATAWATITGGPPILNDSLQSNNTSSNWDASASDPSNNNCSFTKQQYHASVQKTQFPIQPCFAQNTDFINYTYEVTMSIITGDQGGILFRGNEANGTFYYFYININGSYGLDIFNNNTYQTTLKDGISTAIRTGQQQTNLLTVETSGFTFKLFVNKALLATVTDTQSNFNQGEIGVVAQSKGNPTDVAFTNAQAWQQ
jgi:serine/threonine protein kinase